MRQVWLLVFLGIVATSGWSARVVDGAQQSLDPVVVAPQTYHLEFENDWVRVLRATLAPHQTTPLHQHQWKGVLIGLTDQDMRLTLPDGTSTDSHNKAGQPRWSENAGVTHRDGNLSDRPLDIIRVEIKGAKP